MCLTNCLFVWLSVGDSQRVPIVFCGRMTQADIVLLCVTGTSV